MQLTIISGRAGSGKSICLHLLEDLDYYCIDNLPLSLLQALIEKIPQQHSHTAVSIDARNCPSDLHQFATILNTIKHNTLTCQVIYFDAADHILLSRFNETRRKHPLSTTQRPLIEALQQETLLLEPIARLADLRIDTSHLSILQLRDIILTRIAQQKDYTASLLLQSFGYKFGLPLDADFVFDARCLPNPYWEPGLRNYGGLEPTVAAFLQQQPITQTLLKDIQTFLEYWLPHLIQTNHRLYLTIAIGCTGGQHRSVYLIEQLAVRLRHYYPNLQIRHRDL